jgi:hypothetical protein
VEAPNGRHVSFRFGSWDSASTGQDGLVQGPHSVDVVFQVRSEGQVYQVTSSIGFYVYEDGNSTLGLERRGDSYMVVDYAPRPVPTYTRERPVVIELYDYRSPIDKGTRLELARDVLLHAILQSEVVGEVSAPPEISTSAGEISVQGANDQREVTFLLVAPTEDGRLVAGPIEVTVSFEVLVGGQPSTFTGKLTMNIDADGNLKIIDGEQALAGPTVAPGAASIPLKRRFALEVGCQTLGDGRLCLQAAAQGINVSELKYRWWTEDGTLSADSGDTTIWSPLQGAGHQQAQLAAISPEGDMVVVTRDVIA